MQASSLPTTLQTTNNHNMPNLHYYSSTSTVGLHYVALDSLYTQVSIDKFPYTHKQTWQTSYIQTSLISAIEVLVLFTV